MKIGFGTGSFYRLKQLHTKEVVNFCKKLKLQVIELNVIKLERIEWLKEITKEDIKNFSFVSMHAPSQDIMGKLSKLEQKEILDTFQVLHNKLNFNSIVFHPCEWMGDYSIFKDYSFPVSIENMDWRNDRGTTVRDMEDILQKGNFKLIVDLNHCYTHDKTMQLAHDFYKAFKGRISHFHLSDFHSSEDKHTSFYQDRHSIILENIPDSNLPIILEEALKSTEEAEIELKYLKSVLGFNLST